jgi:diguanylate cyclase (GGDEF)-like protein/PAS domain S-box-containing protein
MGGRGADVIDVSAMRMREATIAAGIWLTFGVGAFGETYVALTWTRPHRPGLAVLFALAVFAALAVLALPREQIVRSRMREPFFLAWTMLDFAMLVVGTLLDGGTASPLVLVFFIPVVFSSMSYPLGSVVAVGTVSVISYLALALTVGGASAEYEGGFIIALVCTAAMSAWQAQNHNRQHRALSKASRTDPLTGCLNRRGFEERAAAELKALARSGARGAILVFDIDHFKPVNDTFGHAAGDRLLCWFAQTLESSVRPNDAVGRLGGDEFAAVFPDLDAGPACANAERIVAVLGERAPASFGIAVFPDDGANLEDLTRHADGALYASRQARRHTAAENGLADIHEPPRLVADMLVPAAAQHLEPTDLWRAALDAMTNQRRPSGGIPRDLHSELLDQIDASVICTDMAGVVLSWNKGAETLYGWSAEEAVGRSARELMVPEDASAAERLREKLSADGCWDGELLVRRKDGSLFTAYLRNRLVLDEQGEPAAVVGVAVDISARVAAESERQRDAETLACLHRVERALAEDRFVLHAQPIIDVASGETVQHELLLRMREADGTLLCPGGFLPIAERYALIGKIDRWVIERATRLAGAGDPVQLNLSARSVGDPDVLAHVESCIERNRVAPGLLVFEFTETAIVEDARAAGSFAERLHELGCRVALDDFGTGYGTLTYLKEIPVDYLKLDIEFVSDLRSNEASRRVVQAVISLARDFGLQTVAEGVEDATTLRLLAHLGVDRAQGFHIGRPEAFDTRPSDRRRPPRARARTAERGPRPARRPAPEPVAPRD